MEMNLFVKNPSKRRLSAQRSSRAPSALCGLVVALASLGSVTIASTAHAASVQGTAAADSSSGYWQDVGGTPASRNGAEVSIQPTRFRALVLDKFAMSSLASKAPLEKTRAATSAPLIVSLPAPDGTFQRFSIVESPIMEPGLAAKHPEIKTYAGRGIDNPAASIRMDITPLGLHASVRSSEGAWYIDPYYHLDDSLYASYYARDLVNTRPPLLEEPLLDAQLSLDRGNYRAADSVAVHGAGFAPGANVTISVGIAGADGTVARPLTSYAVASEEGVLSASIVAASSRKTGTYVVTATDGENTASSTYQVVSDAATPSAAVGPSLRTYRLALVTDPSYATYFGGSANVTAAKVTLINRVTQIYESETSIRLVLINDTDKLNLDTAAQATGTNGPCGGTACFTAAQLASCSSSGLTRNRVVVGLLVGASNYDVGHLALGVNGGGIASLGVVGGTSKAQGCTGIPTPVGDYFAVDYVAHELGHQFAGNHTFNGTISNCSTSNRNAGTSVEPGSGSTIMAYAGICGTDNLQPHSDPYWSQRSFDEITAYTGGAETNVAEVQMGALIGYTANGAQFQFSHNGNLSAPIVRGTNFTTAGIKAAIEAISGWPANATVTASAVGDTAFTLTFASAAGDVPNLQLANLSSGVTGYVGEIAQGGLSKKGGVSQTVTGNTAPVVTVPASYTIPVRTPFALTGGATDADGDAVTYMWEQNDRGATGTANGTGLITQPKLNGPLFSAFGTRGVVSSTDTLLYGSPGQNHVTTNPTRVFPDMAQILANNTNAESGVCPTPAGSTLTADEINCFAEYLPTAAYVGTTGVNASPASLNFKLTARDGKGGVNSATTQLVLASGAGPFLVTSHNSAATLDGGSTQTITWNVANTSAAPVSTANVKISLSTDGGYTYPYVLAASTANNGSRAVVLPNIGTTSARFKVEAVGNVFFDVSNANVSIRLLGDANGDGELNCADVAIVKASIGKRSGQAGYDARADLTGDGVVDIRDLTYILSRLPAGTSCN